MKTHTKKIPKKGLNDIIAAVLLIVITLLAVMVLWIFVRQNVERVGDEVAPAVACQQVQLEVLNCSYEPNILGPGYPTDILQVVVRRGADNLDNIEGVALIKSVNGIDDLAGVSPIFFVNGSNPPGQLQTSKYYIQGIFTQDVRVTAYTRGGNLCSPDISQGTEVECEI